MPGILPLEPMDAAAVRKGSQPMYYVPTINVLACKAAFLALLDVALDARLKFAAAEIAAKAGNDKAAWDLYCEAMNCAESLGYEHPGRGVPRLLAGEQTLADAWRRGAEQRHFDDQQLAADRRRERQAVRTARLLAAKDWEGLGVPTPADFVATLAAGQAIEVRGHRFVFEDRVLWFTNPYGQDGALGNEVRPDIAESVLGALVSGHKFGRVPHGASAPT